MHRQRGGGQERRPVQEQPLCAKTVAVAPLDAGQRRQPRQRARMVQQHQRVEPRAAQIRQQVGPRRQLRPSPAPGDVAAQPRTTPHAGFGHENLVGGGARLGHQRHRRADRGRDRADMRQVPDHVADARQRLHDGHVAAVRHREASRDGVGRAHEGNTGHRREPSQSRGAAGKPCWTGRVPGTSVFGEIDRFSSLPGLTRQSTTRTPHGSPGQALGMTSERDEAAVRRRTLRRGGPTGEEISTPCG